MTAIDIKKEPSGAVEKSESKSPNLTERTRQRTVFIPRADIHERSDALVLMADMPGVDQNSVDIRVERRVLTIAGRVKPETVPDHRLCYAEYESGDFERNFTLTEDVDVDKIEATVKDGVLTLVMPKSQKALPRKITVKAG